MNPENQMESPLSPSDMIEKARFKEELVQYETFGVRGFTWFLPFLKEAVAHPDFQARIEKFKQTPTLEEVTYFHQWSGEIIQLVIALSRLARATAQAEFVPTPTFSYHEQQVELEDQLDTCWNSCLQFMRDHKQITNFAAVVGERSVPLDDLSDQDRRHLLALFEHDIKGSRMLYPIYSGTDFLQKEFEFALQHNLGRVVSEGLDRLIPTLERHTFDTYVSPDLGVEELRQQADTFIAKLQADFPTVHCVLENRIVGSQASSEVMHLSSDMLQSILDNCAANVVKIGGTELKITLFTGIGEVYLIIKDNGQGFSAQHTFMSQMELAEGTMIQPIEIIQGNSIWDKTGAVGTGIGLAEIKGYLRDNGGDLFAGNFLEKGATTGGVVVAKIATTPLRD